MCGKGCKTRRPAPKSISGWRRVVTRRVSNMTSTSQTEEDDHLKDIEDGCGCAEVWEHMSEQRDD